MILNNQQIRLRMSESDYGRKLMVTPLLSEEQIGPASIDIRLGSSIIIPRRTYVESQDVTDPDVVQQVEKRRYDRIRLKYNSHFVLHPAEIILGSTFEYLVLPNDVCCMVASRSSWGRLGLVVATASIVQPGFKGCLTLELANLSQSPIALYPGLLVGQLVFQRYDCPTEAGLPAFFASKADDEMVFWGRKGEVCPRPSE